MKLLEHAPKYIQIREEFRRKIEDGVLTPNEQIATEPKLMELYGVSRNTVMNALKDLVRDGLLVRTSGKGTFVKTHCPGLSEKEVVGLAMTTGWHFYESFSSRLVCKLMNHDLFPLIVDISHDRKANFRRIKMLIEKQPPFMLVDAAVGIPPKLFSRYEGQVIFIHRFEYDEEIPASYVIADMRRGGVVAAEHLLDAGYRRIIHYTYKNYEGKISGFPIQEGIRSVLKKSGLPAESFSCWLEDTEAALAKRIKREKQPFALVAGGDDRLGPVYKIAAKLKLRIPEDIGLIGWYNTPWCEVFRPRLTSFAMREDLMADRVVEVITDKEMRGKKILIPPELVIRDSTRRCDG